MVNLNTIAVSTQFEEGIFDHFSIDPLLVKPSNLLNRIHLIQQQIQVLPRYLTPFIFVQNRKNSPDVLLTHRQLILRELPVQLFYKSHHPLLEHLVGQVIQDQVLEDVQQIDAMIFSSLNALCQNIQLFDHLRHLNR